MTARKDLSESNEWKEIRTRLLDYCSSNSGSDAFYDKFGRGILYGIKIVDEWANTYYETVKKEQKKKETIDG